MVILCGIPTDAPFDLLGDALERKKIPFLIFSQHNYHSLYVQFNITDSVIDGELAIGNKSVNLSDITGVYNRMTDLSIIPEYKYLDENDPLKIEAAKKHKKLSTWISLAKTRVVNQYKAMSSNSSKPFQMMLIEEHGFKIPASLITNDPGELATFHRQHTKLIYKSASGVRSIVQELEENDMRKIDQIKRCPTLFQELLEGTNIRVHVIGKKIFATKINSNALDYRYAHKYGKETELEPYQLPSEISERCISLSEKLKLAFTGIDLLLTVLGEWYCFEVNPSPGYSFFENQSGQPISDALADYLSGN